MRPSWSVWSYSISGGMRQRYATPSTTIRREYFFEIATAHLFGRSARRTARYQSSSIQSSPRRHAVVSPAGQLELTGHRVAADAVARVDDDRARRPQVREVLRDIQSVAGVGVTFGFQIVIE
jgi:hypothetical protein